MPSQLPWGCWETTSTFSLQVRNAWMAFLSVHVSEKERVWEYVLNIIPDHLDIIISYHRGNSKNWSGNHEILRELYELPRSRWEAHLFARGLKTISLFRLPDSRLTPFLQCSTEAQKSSFSNFSGKSFSSQHPPIPAIRLQDSSFRKRPTAAFESIKHQISHHKIPQRRRQRLSGQITFVSCFEEDLDIGPCPTSEWIERFVQDTWHHTAWELWENAAVIKAQQQLLLINGNMIEVPHHQASKWRKLEGKVCCEKHFECLSPVFGQ